MQSLMVLVKTKEPGHLHRRAKVVAKENSDPGLVVGHLRARAVAKAKENSDSQAGCWSPAAAPLLLRVLLPESSYWPHSDVCPLSEFIFRIHPCHRIKV